MPPIHIVHNKNCQKRTDSRKRWRTTGSQTLMLYVLTFNKNVPSHSHLCTLSEQTILFDICSLLLFMVCIPRTITTDSVLSHWVFHWSGLLDYCLGLEYHLYYLKNLRSWGHIANYVKQKRAAAASLITCYSVDSWSCIYCWTFSLQDLHQPKTEANVPDGILTVSLLRHQVLVSLLNTF